MGRFDGIAILTDLDGTLLGTGGRMVARNVEAIEYFKAEGGLFTLATGRMHFSLEKWVPGLYTLVNAPALLCNGTYLYDFEKERTLFEIVMDGERAYEMVARMRELFPEISFRVSAREGFLLAKNDVRAVSQIVDYDIREKTIKPFSEWSKEGWYKVVCTDSPETVCRVRETVERIYPNVFEINCSSAHLMEMQMRGVNKSSMLGAFREHYRMQGRELTVYACGDFENDYELLRAADVAVCPSNAMQRIKDICDHCFCSNDDGVIADLVEHLKKARV